MMITPHCEVSQHADCVEIRIKVPHLRMEDGEFYVQDNEFKFHLKPYFVRLTFRQQLLEDVLETATYDATAGGCRARDAETCIGRHVRSRSSASKLRI